MAEGLGKRERTRAVILFSSAHQFAKHGFNGVSMDSLAKAAKLTKGALYDHFPSKEDIYVQSAAHYLEQALAGLIDAPEVDQSEEEALFSFLAKFLDRLNEKPVLSRLILRVLTEETGKNTREIAEKALNLPFKHTVDLVSAYRPDLNASDYAYSFYCNAILSEDLKNVVDVLSPDSPSLSVHAALLQHFRRILAV
jgi:AcrR family transcriptional regulator